MIDHRELLATPSQDRVSREGPGGPARLELTLVPTEDRCTVTLSGTLDGWSAAAVDTQYDQLLGAGFTEVILDMTGVDEIDESGAVALTGLWARLSVSGVFCRIRGVAATCSENPVEFLLSLRASGTQHRPALS